MAAAEDKDILEGLNLWMGRRAFMAERIGIYEDMAEAIRDQESLQSILKKRISRAKERKKPIHHIFSGWLRKMGQGINLSAAAREDLPDFDYMVISAFERSGKVQDGMTFLAGCLNKLEEANAAMKGSMVGPGIVFLMAIAMTVMFSLFAVPLVADIYPPERWPAGGKVLYFVAQLISNHGFKLLFGTIGFIMLIIYSLPRLTGGMREKLENWPIYSTYRQVNGLTVLVGMSAQLKVGVSLVEAIRLIQSQSSPYIKWHLKKIQKNLSKHPDAYGRAFKTGLLDEDILYRLIDFAERSSFPKAVERVGLESFDKVIGSIKANAKTMGGIATGLSGAIIAFLIISFLFTAQGIQKDVQQQLNSTGPQQ